MGRLRDPGLSTLLRELAADNPGLCVLTSRLPLTDLDEYLGPEGTYAAVDLEALAPEAGRELLRARGVRGDDDELDEAVADFAGHALALTLLGSYLAEFHGGDVRRRTEIPALIEGTEGGGHARRVMASYERMFGDSPELTVLMYLGLFDRPATSEALAALRAEPPLLGPVDARSWPRALHRLRQVGLVTRDAGPGEQLDAHPLVREHFGSRLKERSPEREHFGGRLKERAPEAWTEGHGRLYKHYRSAAPDLPDTLAQMEPLFAAVVHGAASGRHQDVHDEILWRRILHGNEHLLTKKLGAFPAYLGCMSPLFTEPWRQTVETLKPQDQSWLLAEAGSALRALGRPREAVEPMEAALNGRVNEPEWRNAAIIAGNLSELHVTLGNLARAEARAREAVEHAEKSQNKFLEIVARTQLADALHHRGDLASAEALFQEAESRQRAWQSSYAILFSLRGYVYCDLLLARGEAVSVAARATQTLRLATAKGWLLDIALDHLSLGRAHLALDELASAGEDFDRAVEGFLAAGTLEDLTRGLLARAVFRRKTGELASARRDLVEAMKLVERSGFRLYAADCALEETRIALAESERQGPYAAGARAKLAEARAAFRRARVLVEEMDYGRRRPELAELARTLVEADETEAKA